MMLSEYRAQATADVADGLLPIRTVTLTLDEAWAPFAQGTLTMPAEPGLLELLDPRIPGGGRRVDVRLEQAFVASGPVADTSAEWPTGTVADISAQWPTGTVADITAAWSRPFGPAGYLPTVHRAFNLGVRDVERTDTDELTVQLASDEALLQDYARVYDLSWWPATTSVRSIVGQVLGMIGATLQPGGADGTTRLEATEWPPGMQAWEYLRPIVQAAGLRLWCDELRRWWLTPATTDTAAAELLLDAAANVTGSRDRVSREGDWYDAVVYVYRWRDSGGVDRVEYDYAAGSRFSRVDTVELNRPYPGPGAAAARLARRLSRGRVQQLDAHGDLTITPGQRVRTRLPDAPEQLGRVSAVSWTADVEAASLSATVTPRDLVTVGS